MVVGNLAEFTETVVLGAGPGGYVAALQLAQRGREVTLIDPEALPGGVCLLKGCIPSKALIEVAHFYHRLAEAETFGIQVGPVKLDWSQLLKWKNGIVEKLGQDVERLLQQRKVTLLRGTATFLDERTLQVESKDGVSRLSFQDAIVAVGGRPRALPNIAFDGEYILSSDQIFQLPNLPASLLVIGGGYIGLELAQVFAKFGSQITIIEALPKLLSGIEPALVRPVQKKLKALGVEVLLETKVDSAQIKNGSVEISCRSADEKITKHVFERVLVAIGRQPNADQIHIERTGIALDPKGYISVNARQQSSKPHIYAIGDVAGGMQLAHQASREAIVAAAVIAGEAEAFDNQVPAVIFTDPEIAYVGKTEAEAKQQGLETAAGIFKLGANGRALTLHESEGFIKIVAEKNSRRILGVQMVGPRVSELIAEATLALEMGATVEDLKLTIHPHPTLSEALHDAAQLIF